MAQRERFICRGKIVGARKMIKGNLRREINFRKVMVENCSNCSSGYYEDGIFRCKKYPGEINFKETYGVEQYYTCKYWDNKSGK